MENVAHAVEIVKMQQRQSVHHAQYCLHAVHTRSQFKSHTEFGAAYLKMIA
jgi:hypothetical protein